MGPLAEGLVLRPVARTLDGLTAPRQLRLLNRSFGALFVAAGVLLATFKRS